MPKKQMTEAEKNASYARLWHGFMKDMTKEEGQAIKSEADMQRLLQEYLEDDANKTRVTIQPLMDRFGNDLIADNLGRGKPSPPPPDKMDRSQVRLKTKSGIRRYTVLNKNLRKNYKEVSPGVYKKTSRS